MRGEKGFCPNVRGVFADHPHVRGEKAVSVAVSVALRGSSPRAWGKDFFATRFADLARIIPTCVGKSVTGSRNQYGTSDHPHVRGEKPIWTRCGKPACGSSPRAWGKDAAGKLTRPRVRIIPTCVGKRRPRQRARPGLSDHPHVRGEKGLGGARRPSVCGSSPRAWGKATSRYRSAASCRIIPTCVGKRLLRRVSANTLADHPHVRGEKREQFVALGAQCGSSPRAWGKGARFQRKRSL